MNRLRTRVWEIVEVARPGDWVSKTFDIAILTLIFLNVVALIAGTVREVEEAYGRLLEGFEVVSVGIFSVEYLTRLWSCRADSAFDQPVRGRIRFAVRPMALVDLLAILPFFLPFLGVDLRFIRAMRLFRIVRVAKIGRYYSSLRLIRSVFIAKKEELILTTVMMLLLLMFSACVMYFCEHNTQPDAFPDIPSTMWWAVMTLTTVGYGDVFPITPVGRFFAAIIAILGIGMFALPTGILGAGFVEEIARRKQPKRICPHCGKSIETNDENSQRAAG